MLSIPFSNTSSIEAVPASKPCFTEQHRALIEEVAQEFDPAKLSSVPPAPEGHPEILEATLRQERHGLRAELAMKLVEEIVLASLAEYGCRPAGDAESIRQWLEFAPDSDYFGEFYDDDGLIIKGSPFDYWVSGEVTGPRLNRFENDAWDNRELARDTFLRRLGEPLP